jgi:hypothetical protein
MSLKDSGPGILSWLTPVSWLFTAVLLALHIGIPGLRLEAPTFAWVVTLAIVVLALTPLAARRSGSLAPGHGRHSHRSSHRFS